MQRAGETRDLDADIGGGLLDPREIGIARPFLKKGFPTERIGSAV